MRLPTVLAGVLIACATALPAAHAAPPPPPAERPALQRPAPGSENARDEQRPGEGAAAQDTPAPGDPGQRLTADGPAHGLFLSVADDDATWVKGASLNCASTPADGSHPHPAAACAGLAAADGQFDQLSGPRHACTKQYAPVTVSATGSYLGRPTAWHRTYPNLCVLEAETGAVFRF